MQFKKSIVLFIALMFISSCGNNIDTNMSEAMTNFEFTTQDKKPLQLDDLRGDWWIANLVYTNCRTICPRTTTNMVDVQNRLLEAGLSPKIVSFSIDPSHDTPKVLKKYAEEYGANLSNWYFLTGYDFETIKKISEDSFKAVLETGAAGQRSHSYAFYLINPDGIIIKQYSGMSVDELDMLVKDVQIVNEL